ncbi:MAG: TolC family protein [Gammaproteobacteria bacterium]|nr:TolC family protein [Gammaproteobacteria bacterium]
MLICRWRIVLSSLLFMASLHAAEPATQSLPEPLTLEYALSLVANDHPRLLDSKHLLDSFVAKRRQAEAADDYSANLTGRARWIDLPVTAITPGINEDHALGISIKKPLLDSGTTGHQLQAAQFYEEAAEQNYQLAIQQRRELIMRRYFDVLLADLQFFRENERMATSYISLDRAKARQKLGQSEEMEILKLDRAYQKVRRDRYHFEGQQRLTRARLAEALNRPGRLSSSLNKPALTELERKRPEVEKLQHWARQHNPQLKALRSQVAASTASVEAARARDGFNVDAEISYNSYTFQPSARENWRAGFNFTYPLSRGGRSDADVALAMSQKYRAQSRLQDAENNMDQAILDTWMQLGTLRIERQEMQALNDYEGFYLDRTRTLYEQGLQTTLGDAMIRITDAEWRLSRTEFDMAMLWVKLEGLVGLPYRQFPQEENK